MFGRLVVALSLVATFGASTASAHFHLVKPTSWLEEDMLGDPQKMGPCGNSGTQTNAVTEFRAGETITVEWEETFPHSGHFRIALARDRSELQDPDIEVDSSCNYDPADVEALTPEYPVLLENLFPRSADEVMFGMKFSQEVTLPDMECEKCTLQVIQFMTEHAQPCIYYHCADIKIVAGDGGASGAGASGSGGAGGASGGAGGMNAGSGASSGTGGSMSNPMMTAGTGSAGTTGGIGAAGSTAGAGGSAAVPTGGATGAAGVAAAPTSSGDSGGCAVARDGSVAPTMSAFAFALGALLLRRRRAR